LHLCLFFNKLIFKLLNFKSLFSNTIDLLSLILNLFHNFLRKSIASIGLKWTGRYSFIHYDLNYYIFFENNINHNVLIKILIIMNWNWNSITNLCFFLLSVEYRNIFFMYIIFRGLFIIMEKLGWLRFDDWCKFDKIMNNFVYMICVLDVIYLIFVKISRN
jgi:hypothetical protein